MRIIISSIAVLALAASLQAQQESARKLELYDIHDLVGRTESAGIQVGADKGSGATGVARTEEGRAADPYVPAVRALLSPSSKVELNDGILTVRATEEEHRGIKELLALFRRHLGRLISVEVRILQSTDRLRQGNPDVTLSRLSAAEADQLQKKAAAGAKAEIFTFPRLTLASGQVGSCDLVRYTAYLSDYGLTVDAAGRLLADPQVDVATAGIRLTFRPVVKDIDNEELLLDDLKISLTEPRQKDALGQTVFRTIKTPVGNVEDPEHRTSTVTLTPLVKAGETLMAGPFSKPWSGEDDPKVWVLLRALLRPADPPKEK